MNRFPDTFRTVTDSCLIGPKEPWERHENADRMVDKLGLHRTGTQCTNPLAQHLPDDHEGSVSAIAVRLVCRCGDRTATTSSLIPKLDVLAVDAGEEHQEEWQAEDDVKGDKWTHTSSKLPVKREHSICGTVRCMSTPQKRKRGHERDRTQMAESGSIPTKVAPKRHATLASGVDGGTPQRRRTDLLSNAALGSSTSSALCCVSGRRFSR